MVKVNKHTDVDVFVVGGGPAGLAAAMVARQHGFRVAVADVLHPPIDKPCGEGLMPDALVELTRLGVLLEPGEYATFQGIRFVGPQGSVEAKFPRGDGVGVRRTTLHSALVAHAERVGIELMWGVRVSSVCDGAVIVDRRVVTTRWIVGADGQNSLVRRWAGLDASKEFERRMALRQHFRTPSPPDFVEIYWGHDSQAYVTPIRPDEICVAIISKRKLGLFDAEVQNLPTLKKRLQGATATSMARGAVTISNRLKRVYRDGIALIGDASGSVDAITGEGIALSFRQALSLGRALAAEDLSLYQTEHRQIEALPQFMRRVMLLMDKSSVVRSRTLRALQSEPRLFERMLSVHVGELPLSKFGMGPLVDLGRRLITA